MPSSTSTVRPASGCSTRRTSCTSRCRGGNADDLADQFIDALGRWPGLDDAVAAEIADAGADQESRDRRGRNRDRPAAAARRMIADRKAEIRRGRQGRRQAGSDRHEIEPPRQIGRRRLHPAMFAFCAAYDPTRLAQYGRIDQVARLAGRARDDHPVAIAVILASLRLSLSWRRRKFLPSLPSCWRCLLDAPDSHMSFSGHRFAGRGALGNEPWFYLKM